MNTALKSYIMRWIKTHQGYADSALALKDRPLYLFHVGVVKHIEDAYIKLFSQTSIGGAVSPPKQQQRS